MSSIIQPAVITKMTKIDYFKEGEQVTFLYQGIYGKGKIRGISLLGTPPTKIWYIVETDTRYYPVYEYSCVPIPETALKRISV